MEVHGLDHVNIVTDDLEGTIAFYREVLGLEPGERPPFPFPGAWLYAGGRAVVHLGVRGAATGPGGAVDHIAFAARGYEAFRRRLAERGIPHSTAVVPGTDMRQIFLRDPNGVKIELTFRD